VQGFPALERLLFEADALAQLQAQPFRCQLVEAIAANIATIADGIAQRWSGEFRGVIADPAQSGQFENAQDATVDFYKALVESVRRYQQQKLEPVLGESRQQVRERRAESWRSQRSLRNLKLDVAALQHLFTAGTPALSTALPADAVASVDAAFTALQQTLAPLPDDFAPLLTDAAGYAQLQTVVTQLDALYEALEAALKRTDLYLGFNSLDGD
jgi:predicted lipoprotein